MSERAGGGTGQSTVSKCEMKQFEKQNSRFPDTLVRIQDLSAHGKHEFQKLQKDMDKKTCLRLMNWHAPNRN
jgi:dynactin 1